MKLVKREDAIRIAEAQGYKVEIDSGFMSDSYLVDPNGQRSRGEINNNWSWKLLPQSVIERDGFVEDYDWVNEEGVQIVDETDSQAMEAIIQEHGKWGVNAIVLTRKDIEALMNGKAIVWGQGEYSSVIYFTEEKPE